MMVYLVSDGCYSDYRVLGIYSTPEKADEAKAFFAADNDVQPCELDALPDTNVPPGFFVFGVDMNMNGDVARTYRNSNDLMRGYDWAPSNISRETGVTFYVAAKDEAGAIKIANERRIMLKASGELHTDWRKWFRERHAKAEGE